MHHAHHRGHNTERGQAVGDFLHGVRRHLRLVVMSLDLMVHQVLDFERIHIAADHQA